jgi:hypothetical protein
LASAETGWLDFRLAFSWARVVASAVPPTEPTLIERRRPRSDGSVFRLPLLSTGQPCRYRPAVFFR